jgi:hypothetical protein
MGSANVLHPCPGHCSGGWSTIAGDVLILMDRIGACILKANSKTQSSQVGAGNTAMTNCVGQLRYTSTVAGVIDLRCDAAFKAKLQFTMLSEMHGYTCSQATETSVSLVYGFAPDEAKAYLELPPNKQLFSGVGGANLELC